MQLSSRADEHVGSEECEKRKCRQDVMRELGLHDLEHDPRPDDRRERESDGGEMPASPGVNDRRWQQQAPWEVSDPDQQQVVPGWSSVSFESGAGALKNIVPEGRRQKIRLALVDQDQPRRTNPRNDRDADKRLNGAALAA